MTKQEKWEHCPRCDSSRVIQISKWAMFVAFLGTGSCMIWLGVLFPPFLLLASILIVIGFIMLLGKSTLQCQD